MKYGELAQTRIDLGSGRDAVYFTAHDDAEQLGEVIGLIETHPLQRVFDDRPAGAECAGVVFFDVPGNEVDRPKWTVECWEPLTLSPSILCGLCGNHGFIRGGRWVEA